MEERYKIRNERIQWIDTARTIAIIAVVLCHVIETIFFYSEVDVNSFSLVRQSIVFGAFTFGRIGVPIFLFISGWLLLSRTYDDKKCVCFWKQNFWKLLCVTEVWTIFYYIFACLMRETSFSVLELGKQILFLKQSNMSHMWYMPMILGMYLFLPFVANTLNRVNEKLLYFPLVIMIIYSFLIPTFNILWRSQQKEMLYGQLSLEFGGGKYGVYIILGWFFYKGIFPKIKKIFLWLGFLSSFLGTILFQMFMLKKGYEYRVWYDFIMLLVAAICIFGILEGRNLQNEKTVLYRLIKSLAKDSFGIYLLHKPVLNILVKYVPVKNMNYLYKIIFFWMIILLVSWGIVEIFSKMGKLGKNLFLVK